MHEMKKKYMKILRIEIEDLREDINDLIEHCKKESETEIISSYVSQENIVIFRKELSELEIFFKILDSIDPDKFENLDELIEFIRDRFTEKIKEFGLIRAIGKFIDRKMIKVKKYVIHE